MTRLTSLLLMIALVITNGPAIASALCRHADAAAHAAALQSDDHGVAASAVEEDRAAAAASKKGMLADAASVQLAGFVTPSEPVLPLPLPTPSPIVRAVDEDSPPGRALRPLLEPPLA